MFMASILLKPHEFAKPIWRLAYAIDGEKGNAQDQPESFSAHSPLEGYVRADVERGVEPCVIDWLCVHLQLSYRRTSRRNCGVLT